MNLDHLTQPRASAHGLRLAALKERLLREQGLEPVEPALERLYRLAASEAEALAWQTPVPLLVMPTLLDEKLDGLRQYLARQTHLRARTGPAPPVKPRPRGAPVSRAPASAFELAAPASR